jgi:hypothetical protein
MAILSDYIKKQAELEKLKKELEALQSDDRLSVEMEFRDKVLALMAEYGKNEAEVIRLLDPGPAKSEKVDGRKQRRLKKYINPHTKEVVETRGGNHKTIRAWKDQHGQEEVESWVV